MSAKPKALRKAEIARIDRRLELLQQELRNWDTNPQTVDIDASPEAVSQFAANHAARYQRPLVSITKSGFRRSRYRVRFAPSEVEI